MSDFDPGYSEAEWVRTAQSDGLLGEPTELPDARSILCVQPHPDDTDIALGATVAMLAGQSVEITYLSVTDDAAGLRGKEAMLPYSDRVELRRTEQNRAASTLGVHAVLELGYPDAGDWSVHEVRERIVDVIRSIRPDVVLTCDPWVPYEAHRDHVKTGIATAEAVLLHGFPAFGTADADPDYSIAAVGFFFTNRPNRYFDSGRFRKLKLDAVAAHGSQFTGEELALLERVDRARGASYGSRIGVSWAEGLKLMRPEWLHVLPEAGIIR